MPKERLCIQCGKKLPHSRWKYCSNECRQAFLHNRWLARNPLRGKTSATTGAISELRVAVDLLSKGYDVFRAVSPNSPCDLAVLKNGHLLRIEVRTTYRSASGKIYGVKDKRDDIRNIDHYALVLTDEIVYDPPLE